MKFNLTALIGITSGSLGLIVGTLLPQVKQNYGIVVVTGITNPSPAMDEYRDKFDSFLKKTGCQIVVLDRDTLRMEGDGGPLTVIMKCLNSTKQDQVDLYKSDEYQHLSRLRAPFTDWDFRIVQGRL